MDFKAIDGGRHLVYRDGRVYNVKGEYFLHSNVYSGVLRVTYPVEDGRPRNLVAVKKLVYEAFCGEAGATSIFHKDDDPLNCSPDNLYLCWMLVPEVMQRNKLKYANGVQAPGPFSRYLATREGQVYNIMIGREVSGCEREGYLFIRIQSDNRENTLLNKSRLVYLCFNPSFDINNDKIIIDHIDEDRSNNNIANLRQGHRGDNNQWSYDINPTRAINMGDSNKIGVEIIQNGAIKLVHGTQEAAAALGITSSRMFRYISTGKEFEDKHIRYKFEDTPNATWWRVKEYTHSVPDALQGLEGLIVSDSGSVVSLATGKQYKVKDTTKCPDVKFFYNGISRKLYKVLCFVFHGPPPPGKTPDHIDRDHNNNDPRNLRWADKYEQINNRTCSRQITRVCIDSGTRTTYGSRVAAAASGLSAHLIKKAAAENTIYDNAYWEDVPTPPQSAFIGPMRGDPRICDYVDKEYVKKIVNRGGEKNVKD
jgi:hypothetical protein